MASRIHDFLATHIGQLIYALAEFRAVDVLRDQVRNISIHTLRKLALLLVGNGHKTHRLLRRDRWHGIGRREFQFLKWLGHSFGRHRKFPLALTYQQMERVPDHFKHLRPQLYYFSNTVSLWLFKAASTSGDNPSTTRDTPCALG